MVSDPIFYAAAIPAVIILGLGKGGFAGAGQMALPLMAMTIAPIQAAAIIQPILMVQDLVGMWAYRRSWDRRNMLILVPGSIVGVLAGYLLAHQVSDAVLSLFIGAISLAFALWRLVLEGVMKRVHPARPLVGPGLFCGFVSGFTSMVSHAGAAPFQIYVMPQRLPRDRFIGTSVLFFGFTNWTKAPAFFALGQLTPANLATSAALIPLAIVSTWAGIWLVRRVDPERFYGIIYGLLALFGAKLIWDGATALL